MPEIRNDKQIYRLMNSIFFVSFYELFNCTAAGRIIAFRCGPCDVTPMPSTSGYVSLLVDVLIEKFHGPLGTASVAMVKGKYKYQQYQASGLISISPVRNQKAAGRDY